MNNNSDNGNIRPDEQRSNDEASASSSSSFSTPQNNPAITTTRTALTQQEISDRILRSDFDHHDVSNLEERLLALYMDDNISNGIIYMALKDLIKYTATVALLSKHARESTEIQLQRREITLTRLRDEVDDLERRIDEKDHLLFDQLQSLDRLERTCDEQLTTMERHHQQQVQSRDQRVESLENRLQIAEKNHQKVLNSQRDYTKRLAANHLTEIQA
jgi:hypothetical protein